MMRIVFSGKSSFLIYHSFNLSSASIPFQKYDIFLNSFTIPTIDEFFIKKDLERHAQANNAG